MDLDFGQARRFFLAGTVAFPTPYLSVGTISFPKSTWRLSQDGDARSEEVVMVQEPDEGSVVEVRVIRQKDVAAIFVSGSRDEKDKFHISREERLCSLEDGEWFVDSDANLPTILERLEPRSEDSFERRDSLLRGIVFVTATARVLSIRESSTTAITASAPSMSAISHPGHITLPEIPMAGCLGGR